MASKSGGEHRDGAGANEHRSAHEQRESRQRRANSSEWKQYYERADRIRDRLGDPFKALIERADARQRLSRTVGRVAAVMMVLTLLAFAMWLLLDLSYD